MNPYDFIEENFMFEPREYKQCEKTEEEMRNLMYDDSVSELERYERNINSDNFLQKVSVYEKLDRILMDIAMKKAILPVILQQLPKDSKQMQLQAAAGFKKGLLKGDIEINVALEVFDLCLHIFGQWNLEVIDEWMRIFEILIQVLDWGMVVDKLERLTKMLSLSSQPIQSRYAAVKIIGATAKLKGSLIEGLIFDRCIHLTADYEKDVRLALAEKAIKTVYAAVKSPVCKNILFEKVFELVYDPDQDVKIATIKLIVRLLDEIDEQAKREKIALLFSEIISNVHDKIILAVSECLSKIILKLGNIILKNNALLNSFINFFKEVSMSKNKEIVSNFIFNFPAMIKYVDAKIYSNFKLMYLSLSKSGHEKIQMFWIFVLLDIVDLVEDEEKITVIRPAFEDFMKIPHAEETDLIILKDLYRLFEAFYKSVEKESQIMEKKPLKSKSSKKKKTSYKEPQKPPMTIFSFSKGFFKRIKALNKWRIEIQLIETLFKIAEESDIMEIFDDYSQFMLDSMENGCAKVRKSACQHLSQVIALLPSFEKKKMIMKKVYEKFYYNSNFQKKETFVNFADSCIDHFSRASLRHFILKQTLALSESPIQSIQIGILRILPKIHLLLVSGEDSKVFSKISEIKKKFSQNESKRMRDVLRSINSAIQIGMKSKKRQNIIKAKYEKNRKQEEELLLFESEESSLKEMYKKEERANKNKGKGFDMKKSSYGGKFNKGIDRFPSTSYRKYSLKPGKPTGMMKKMKSYNLDDKKTNGGGSSSKKRRKNSDKKKKR